MKGPEAYVGHTDGCDGDKFEPWGRRGFQDIQHLRFLTGRPWDDVALAWVHSLRPSRIRVLRWEDGQQLDSVGWRVTVTLDEHDRIMGISQEAEVGLFEGCAHGRALQVATAHGVDSELFRWFQIPGDYVSGFGETKIIPRDGSPAVEKPAAPEPVRRDFRQWGSAGEFLHYLQNVLPAELPFTLQDGATGLRITADNRRHVALGLLASLSWQTLNRDEEE